MENSAVEEHVKLCMSTIPVRTESSWRLAGSEDKVEQIHTLCHPKDPSIAQSSLWKRPQRKFGFSRVMPVWKKYHSSLEPGQAVGVLPESPCLILSRSGTVPVPLLLAFALSPQTSAGCVGHRDMQNQGAPWCNPLIGGKKNPPCFAALQEHRSFQTGAETLSIASQCHMLGFYFLLFSSLGPGSAKVQPAAAPFFDYWWGLGFIFYIQLCRCVRHFTQIYKDRALKNLYSPNMSQHS